MMGENRLDAFTAVWPVFMSYVFGFITSASTGTSSSMRITRLRQLRSASVIGDIKGHLHA